MMAKELRLLIVEDSEDDSTLLVRELRKGGFEPSYTRVESLRHLEAALDAGPWDAVISDFNLPGFNGLDALRLVQSRGQDIPFILVSGTIGEEKAVEAMKAGAHDYIMKGRYSRLAPAMERELREAANRGEQRRGMEALQEKEQLLMHQSRLAAMGEMINSIAHQWRQPLNSLTLFVQLLKEDNEDGRLSGEFVDSSVDQIMSQIAYMTQTIDDFRNFFRPDQEMKQFNLLEKIRKTLVLVGDSFKASYITVETEAEEDLIVTGYPKEYCQVLLNILNNARDALTERKISSPLIKIRLFREGEKSVATISDNAGGIPDTIIDRIFEPYFTTKDVTKGTGIGLHISRTIIEKRMNGRISARNTDHGAEFRIEV